MKTLYKIMILVFFIGSGINANAQFLKKLGDKVENADERKIDKKTKEQESKLDRKIEEGVDKVFDTPEEAISMANDNIYGLAASIWSQDVNLPLRVARELETGTVWINDWAKVNDEFEEGGYKLSGNGRLNGLAAMQEFIEYKHIFHHAGTLNGRPLL